MGKIVLPNEIVTSDKTPRTATAFDKTSGVKQTPDTARDVMLVVQRLATGTVAENIPKSLFREDDGALYFGAGSIGDVACRAAFKANPFCKLHAVGIDDAGTKAEEDVVFVGTATCNTVFRLRIGGKEVAIDVTDEDTITEIGDALEAAINADTSLPVTANNAAGTVTLTARNGGTIGNGIKLRGGFDATTDQVTTTVTIPTALAGGVGEVDVADALAAITGARYHIVGCTLDGSAAGADLRDHLDEESDAEHDHGEIGIQVINGTLSDATTLALALNGNRNIVAAINGSESWSVEICAAMAAAMSREEVATRPYNGMELKGIIAPPVESRWRKGTETRSLIDNGVTPLYVKPGEKVAIMRAVSTGVKNEAGDYDYSTLDITKFQAFDFFRDGVNLMFETNYGAARWADSDPEGLLPVDVATPEKVTIDLIDVARDMEAEGIVQNVEALRDQFFVEKDGDGCIFSIPAAIVDGMHRRLGKIVYINRPLAR
jgi:phage tail sheath gpL-like